MPSPSPERHGLPFRRLALLCAALLSCTTIRTPVSTIEPAVTLREGRPEPQLELWVESNKPLSPAEMEQFRGEARAALEKALEGRSQEQDGDELVVIRAQGVTRTRGHRNDQVAATTGIVVGAVVIVAAVIVAFVVGGKSNSHGSSGSHAPRGLPSASAPRAGGGASVARAAGGGARVPARLPTASAPRFRGVAAPRVPVARGFPVAPAPHAAPWRPSAPAPGAPAWPAPRRHVGPTVNVEVGFWWMIPVEEPEPFYPYEAEWEPPPAPAPGEEMAEAEPTAESAGEEAPQEIPAEFDQLSLAAPEPFPVEDRGFFAGDRLTLEAIVVDRTTGEALRVKRIARKVDPRNAGAVKDAIDALLSDGGWQPPAAD